MSVEYKVLSIDELAKPGEGGGIVRFYRHRIKTTGGVILTVDIPEENLIDTKAIPILKQKAIEVDKILNS